MLTDKLKVLTDLCTAVQLVFVAVRLSVCTVYAKLKLLIATLTHLQSNSSSVVVYELASSFYGSVKIRMASVCFAYMTTDFLLSCKCRAFMERVLLQFPYNIC